MVFRLRTITHMSMLMFSLAPMLIMAHAFSNGPTSPLSPATRNEFVDNFTPIHNGRWNGQWSMESKDQSHDEIEKEVREWITDEVSIISNIVIIQGIRKLYHDFR